MLSHVMVGTNNIERAKQFYDAVLAVLGAGEGVRNPAPSGHIRLFYLHDGSMFCVSEPINGEPATFANGGTIGFKCHSPEQVQAFHDVAVAHGGRRSSRGGRAAGRRAPSRPRPAPSARPNWTRARRRP